MQCINVNLSHVLCKSIRTDRGAVHHALRTAKCSALALRGYSAQRSR